MRSKKLVILAESNGAYKELRKFDKSADPANLRSKTGASSFKRIHAFLSPADGVHLELNVVGSSIRMFSGTNGL